jgi:hypothetical protein
MGIGVEMGILTATFGFKDIVTRRIGRGRDIEQFIKFGPNPVHAVILHGGARPNDWALGSIEDLGIAYNLITNGGKDYVADALGGALGFGVSATIATGSSATSLTATSTPFVASAYIGQIVIAEESTNAPVWANIVANTTGALTVDSWKNGDGSAGSTPGATANYQILPGSSPANYMALTENSGAASASDTALTGELTTGSCGRALATYAHTPGASTYTLVKAFSVGATFPAIHKMGLFPHSTASTGPLIFETVLNADANVLNGDTLTITETVTLS